MHKDKDRFGIGVPPGQRTVAQKFARIENQQKQEALQDNSSHPDDPQPKPTQELSPIRIRHMLENAQYERAHEPIGELGQPARPMESTPHTEQPHPGARRFTYQGSQQREPERSGRNPAKPGQQDDPEHGHDGKHWEIVAKGKMKRIYDSPSNRRHGQERYATRPQRH